MSQLAYTLRTERNVRKRATPVIPIYLGKKVESSKQHQNESKEIAKKDIPLFYTRPIFKAKEHDPL